MPKWLKVVFAVVFILMSLPALDAVVRFFMRNTRRYITHEQFEI